MSPRLPRDVSAAELARLLEVFGYAARRITADRLDAVHERKRLFDLCLAIGRMRTMRHPLFDISRRLLSAGESALQFAIPRPQRSPEIVVALLEDSLRSLCHFLPQPLDPGEHFLPNRLVG